MADYTLEREGQRRTVTLHGDLTATVVPPLQAALRAELDAGAAEVSFDLGATRMIDSTGIGLLIATANSVAPRRGKVRVRNASRDVVRLFQSMRLTSRLDVSGREEGATHG